jgi:hypothetical protein
MNELQKDLNAMKLAEVFVKHYRKYSFSIFNPKNAKESKWWNYFVKTVELYGDEEGWNPSEYISFNFEENGKILPFFLPTKKAFETWNNKRKRGKTDIDVTIVKNLLSSYNMIKTFCKKNNTEFSNQFFIGFYPNQLKLIRKDISIHYIIISKCLFKFFKDNLKRESSIELDKTKVEKARMFIFKNKKILSKMEELFKDDFLYDLDEFF